MAKAKTTKSTKKPASSSAATATTVRRTTLKNRNLAKDLVLGALFAELLGTFILTMVVLNTGGNIIVAAVAVIILVMVLSRLSGGHVNPAVTIGLLATKQISLVRAGGYLVAQLLGGMLALVVVTQFMQSGAADPFTGQAAEAFKVTEATGQWRPFFAEALGGLLFGLGVAAAVLGRKEGLEKGFLIGGALLLALVVATLGSAALVNPAVAIGLSAYNLDNWWTVLAYAVGPVVGVVLGVWAYKLLQWDVDGGRKGLATK